MELRLLDHTDQKEAERICKVLLDSYSVEARLIGADDFPPLRRQSDDIRRSASTFYGGSWGGRLVAVAEIEESEDGSVNIAGFVVHPEAFRRGIGSRLLRHVMAELGAASFTVSTAASNRPAIALYGKHGFRLQRRWMIGGIDMVTLARDVG
jgi:ribosomal protein S18 acetylase RimI-like enzyme